MTLGMTVRELSMPDPDRWLPALTDRPSFLSGRFPVDPADTAALRARVGRVGERFSRPVRDALARALADGLRAHGAGTPAIEAALSLSNPETVCIVTGQQPGVLLSPFYSVVKAAGTVAQARCWAERLGCPVVPVFWTATEDHDVGEVERVRLVADGTAEGEMDFHLWQPIPRGRFPVGGLDVREALGHMLDRIEASPVLTGAYRDETLALARTLIRAHGTLGGHFMALLNRVFDGTPLVVLDPMQPELRNLVAPMFARLIREGDRVADAIDAGSRALLDVSGERSVQAPWRPDETGVFYLVDGQRAMLERSTAAGRPAVDEPLAPRGRPDLSRPRGAWADEAAVHPGRFSSDVHLRPLVQETLLPVLAVVLGPGETRYWAQLTELFAAMDLAMPLILPRARVTLVPPHVGSLVTKLGLTVEEVLDDWPARLEAAVLRRDRIGIARRFDRYEEDMRNLHAGLMADLEPLGADFARHGEPNLTRHLEAAVWLRAKALKAHREGNDTLIRRFRTAGGILAPHGQPQDRYWSAFAFLAQEGPDLGSRLAFQDGLLGTGLLGVWTGTSGSAVGTPVSRAAALCPTSGS